MSKRRTEGRDLRTKYEMESTVRRTAAIALARRPRVTWTGRPRSSTATDGGTEIP